MNKLIAEIAEIIKECSRCGFCMVDCPAYKATKMEWDAARGRNKLTCDMIEGDINFDQDIDDPIDTCLRCGRCTANCPSKVNTPKAIQLLRTIRYQAGKMKLPYRILFEQIFPHPKIMAAGSAFMSGVQSIMPVNWLDGGVAAHLFPSAKMLPRLPFRRARSFLPLHNKAVGKHRGTVLYFLGCATDLVYPDVAKSTVNLLNSQGIDVLVPPVSCCGLPSYSYGHIDGTLRLINRNLEIINLQEVDAVVGDCPTCISFLKEYKDFSLDTFSREKAELLFDKAQHLPDYLLKLGLLKPKREMNQIITYHQPCHFGLSLEEASSLMDILRNLPGIEFRKADNQNTCCGGAGSYCFTQIDRSQSILTTKLEGIAKTQAKTVVTNCPACMMQLQAGFKHFPDIGSKPDQLINFASLLAAIYCE